MLIKEFTIVTTAIMALYSSSSSFATQARDEIERMSNRNSIDQLYFEFEPPEEKNNPKVKSKNVLLENLSNYAFQLTYEDQLYNRQQQLVSYEYSWNKYFKDSIVSGAKYVSKIFGGLFY